MKPDGTVVLFLRAESPDGIVGDAMCVYAPSHARYAAILEHLGPLVPGEDVAVRAWPEPTQEDAGGDATLSLNVRLWRWCVRHLGRRRDGH